jgi:hypothetical protein
MKTDHAAFRPARPVIATAILLMLPLIAMQVTDEVAWGPEDFLVAGVLLAGTGLLFELIISRAATTAYRFAAGLGLGSALFLVWANLAVGIVGDEGNAVNALYFGVIAVGIVGANLAMLQPRGMALTMYAMAAAQALIAVAALAMGLGGTATPPTEILGVNALFVALFATSATLFRHAAREGETAQA